MARAHRIEFDGSDGQRLAGRLDRPDAEPVAYAVFAHCFTCGKDVVAASRVARGLVAAGYGVLRFDFTGLGSSDGDFANTTFSSNVDDLRRAAAWLATEHAPPSLLIGHSLGGAAVLVAGSDLPDVGAVVTLGAPSDVTHVEGLLTGSIDTIERDGEAEVSLAGRRFRIRRSFLDDLRATSLLERVAALRRPLLVLHSPVDTVVGVEHAGAIFGAARHPRSFVAIDGADHLLTDPADAEWVAGVVAAWAARYRS